MAGDERNLKDARIQVKLDLSAARRELDELEVPGGRGRSKPGVRPPSPGRDEQRKEREKDNRKPGVGTGVAVGATAKGGGALGTAFKSFIVLTVVAEVAKAVSGMAAGAVQGLAGHLPDTIRNTLGLTKENIASAFQELSLRIGAMEAVIPNIVGTVGDVGSLAGAQAVAFGKVDTEALARFARLRAIVRGADSGVAAARREFKAEAAGRAGVNLANQLLGQAGMTR